MKCPNCNETEHEPNAKFCHVCGWQLAIDRQLNIKASVASDNPSHKVGNDNVVSGRLQKAVSSTAEREKRVHYILLIASAGFVSFLEFAACAAGGGWGWGIVPLLANIAYVFYRVYYLEEVWKDMDWDGSDERRKEYLFSLVPLGVLSVFTFCIRNGWILLVLPLLLCISIYINKWIHDTFLKN